MKQSKKKSKVSPQDHYSYLHGYNSQEQERLIRQAKFFENEIYKGIQWPEAAKNILEPGCGVGAQTEILIRRFPECKITAVDRSETQLKQAEKYLSKSIREGRVKIQKALGEELPFPDSSFEGSFICFVLEHVKEPVKMLREIHRVMSPGAPIYCTEVLNSSFYFHPYAPATLQYCFAFNDHQWNMGGDPFCGAKLGNHLMDAGFQNIETQVHSFLLDRRMPKTRNAYFEDYFQLLRSGAPSLIESKVISASLVKEMELEWKKAMIDPHSVLFFSLVQARGAAL